MKKFLTFVAIGSLVALVVEFQFNLLATHNPGNFIFTLFFYPLYLSVVYQVSSWLDSNRAGFMSDLLYYLFFGLLGLAFEWFVIGNSPWGNPEASNIGMWAFWVAVALVPRIMTRQAAEFKAVKKGLVYYLGTYSVASTIMALMLPEGFRLFWIVVIHMVAYIGFHLFYWQYFRLRRRNLS